MADTAPIPTVDANRFQSISLADPIRRGEQVIETITLRKPRSGELRGGINLQDLMVCDVATVLKVLPRISDPVLTPDECDNLDPSDLAQMGGTIRGFFMTPAEKSAIDAMIAEQRPKT